MPDDRSAIRLEAIVKEYAGGVRAVDGVALDVPEGAFVVLLGPSGCGKTTLLKSVNRLLEPTSGRIFIDGEDALAADPVLLRRRIGYVIQQVGLFGHMTVAENVSVVPELLRWPKRDIAARIDELLALVHLEPSQYRQRYPAQLSGGQQQRVGLARALAADPKILLMDEPFGAIDAIERTHLQDEMAALHARLRKTILFVTHDVDEALRLADRIVVMRDGKVEQDAAPLDVMTHPSTRFVSDLLDTGDVVRRFGVMKVAAAMSAADGVIDAQAPSIGGEQTMREALSLLLSGTAESLVVRAGDGAAVGRLSLADIRRAARPAA